MAQIFMAFLLTSGIGTALALILATLRPLTRKVFSAAWHYYVWLGVLLVMVLPLRFNMPKVREVTDTTVNTPFVLETTEFSDNRGENIKAPEISESHPEHIADGQLMQPEKMSGFQTIADFLSSKTLLFACIWLTVAVFLFFMKVISYLIFLIKIHKHSELVSCPEIREYTKRKIKTRASDTICSPLMIGIIRPTLILPKTEITPEQFQNVLVHEMTHLKRNDILYKWFVSIVKCIHWFNPAIYFISRQINIDCEISCDLAVVKEMDKQAELSYVETILSLLTHNNKKAVFETTGMTGNKKTLKRRFVMIKKRKRIGKITQIISAILAFVILITAFFVSGVLAAELLKEDKVEPKFEIEVRHNGYPVKLENEPFFENDVLYLPLRELFEKTGFLHDEQSYVKWNDGKITLCLTENDNAPNYDDSGNQIGTKPIIIQYYYGLEIGKSEYILNPAETLPANRQHLSKSKEMTNAPILKEDVTYIPYEYVDCIINRTMTNNKMTIGNINDTSKDISASTEKNQIEICAFIKEINNNIIILDEVEYITDENQKRIKELKLTDFDMPNGYYINNAEIKFEEYILTEKTTYNFIDWKNDFVEDGEDRAFSTENKKDFIKYLNTYENAQPKMPFFIDIMGNKVISITEKPMM